MIGFVPGYLNDMDIWLAPLIPKYSNGQKLGSFKEDDKMY